MKRIRLCIIASFVMLLHFPLSAQGVFKFKYEVHGIYKDLKVDYKMLNESTILISRITYDGKDLFERSKEYDNLQKKLKECEKEREKTPQNCDELERQLTDWKDSVSSLEVIIIEKDVAKKQQIADLNHSLTEKQRQVDSLRRVLEMFQHNVPDNCMHIGLQYRIGLPQLLNPLLSQMDGQGEKIWSRNLTLSHHVGLFYGTASLVENFPLSVGVGVEYDQLRFKAGIGHLDNTIQQAMDADNDPYTAYLSCDNVLEDITLRYVSIPFSLSLGQPYMDRISGYGQFTIAPSICVAQKLSSSGIYSLAGYYSQLSGSDVDLYMDDVSSLGFGSGFEVADVQKSVSVSRFVLVGRLSAGFYLPLCNLKKGKSSPCVFKMGVSVDITCTPIAKDLGNDTAMPEAQYRLQQYNLLNGQGCRYVSPALEVGLLYLIKKH